MISIAVLLTGIGGVSAPAAAEKILLKITDWQAGVQNILNSYREFIRIFEEKHPNVKVEYTQYSYTTYEEFLKPAVAAGTASDIFAIFPGVPLIGIADSGNVVPLSDVMDDEWKSWLGKAYYVSGLNYKGKLWASPQDAQTVGIWFYKDMLEALGVEVPPLGAAFTVDELTELAEPARQHGWDLIAAGLDPKALLEIETDNPVFNDCLKMYYSTKGRFSEYWYKKPEGVDTLFVGIVNVMIGQDTIDNVLATLDEVSGHKG